MIIGEEFCGIICQSFGTCCQENYRTLFTEFVLTLVWQIFQTSSYNATMKQPSLRFPRNSEKQDISKNYSLTESNQKRNA